MPRSLSRSSQPPLSWFKSFVSAVLCICCAILAIRTLHWPVISDASFMHYVIFLMHHGMTPYRDIIDINMPGTYLIEEIAVRVFGNGPLGWRFFDFTLILLAALAMIWIARPSGIFAGFVAGTLFALIHWSGGTAQLGQRDLVVAVFRPLAYAAIFSALRTGSWPLTGLSGFCFGCAATVKPQAVFLAIALLGLAAYTLRRRRQAIAAHLLCGFAGLVIPAMVCLLLLARERAVHSFLSMVRGLDIYHAGMARHSAGFLLAHAIPSLLVPVALIAAWFAIDTGYWRTWEGAAILLGVCFGFGSFCLQGKAYPYHRYPLVAFLLLFISIQLTAALRINKDRIEPPEIERGANRCHRALAYAGLIFCTLWIAPAATAKALRYDWRDQATLDQMRWDLNQLGGERLSGQIQCMDTIAGCLTILDRMQLTQATGFLYDCYLLAPQSSPVQEKLREEFWRRLQQRPPHVFVVTNDWCFGLPGGYRKLEQWPALSNLLATDYNLSVQREPKPGNYKNFATWPFGYRIYVRKP